MMTNAAIPFQNIDLSLIPKVEHQGKTGIATWQTYIVSDDLSSHRSVTKNGVKLLIFDGYFLAKAN